MYTLDANSVIYFFKGMGRVGRRLLATSPGEVALSAVVVCELETGVALSVAPERRSGQLAALLAVVRILPFGAAEARSSAQLRATLTRAGTPIGPLDTLIAGTALLHGATLVTHNTKEFMRVKGLTLEDWY